MKILVAALFILVGCKPVSAQVCSDQFWNEVEKYESGGNRLSMYREDGIPGGDDVTGMPFVISEGTYQLSYGDLEAYGPECDFNFEKDKVAFLDDVRGHETGRRSFESHHPERLILQKAANRACAEAIAKKLLTEGRSLGAYWSTVRDGLVKTPCR